MLAERIWSPPTFFPHLWHSSHSPRMLCSGIRGGWTVHHFCNQTPAPFVFKLLGQREERVYSIPYIPLKQQKCIRQAINKHPGPWQRGWSLVEGRIVKKKKKLAAQYKERYLCSVIKSCNEVMLYVLQQTSIMSGVSCFFVINIFIYKHLYSHFRFFYFGEMYNYSYHTGNYLALKYHKVLFVGCIILFLISSSHCKKKTPKLNK